MATLATSVLVEDIALILSRGYIYVVTDPLFLGLARIFIPPSFRLPLIFYWAIGLWLIAIFITLATPFGRAIYAIGGNLYGAKLAGINIKQGQNPNIHAISTLCEDRWSTLHGP